MATAASIMAENKSIIFTFSFMNPPPVAGYTDYSTCICPAKQERRAKVTLRGSRMEEFMDKLVNIALPRVRDFRGVSDKAFDGRGNYALGIREQLLFPEIEYDKVEKIRGMEMIFVTTAQTDEECKELLRLLGMPFAQ